MAMLDGFLWVHGGYTASNIMMMMGIMYKIIQLRWLGEAMMIEVISW